MKVTSKGQVTIPKNVREELGLRPGDEITFEETDEGYVIRKNVDENCFEKYRGVAETDESVEDRMRALRGDRR